MEVKMADVSAVIEKWYKRIGFPERYDDEFYQALGEISIDPETSIETYDLKCEDGRKNLLSFLYMCETLSKKYAEKGIDDGILLATVRDILLWTNAWSEVKGEMYLGELPWLEYHMKMKLFRIGRLQFCHTMAGKAYPELGITEADGTLDVHIPADGRLDICECRRSLDMAREFYRKYFPEAHYTYFNCHSWLLDPTLKKYLPEESNIIGFGEMFDRIRNDESLALLRYIFRWDVRSREMLEGITPTSGFSARIKEAALGGETFYETLGIIKKGDNFVAFDG